MEGRQAEVVVAGHICLDVIPTFGEREGGLEALLVPGKLVEVGPAVLAPGGAVSNTGLALHRLGVPTRLMGKVGDDLFGRAILDVLRQREPALAEGMIVTEGEPSSYTLVVNPPGVDRIFFHCPGTNDTFGAGDVADEQVAGARLFHFGYPPIMRRMYSAEGRELEALLRRVKAHGLTTSLDMAKPDPESDAGRAPWPALLARVLPFVDVFLPSLDEILFMLDREHFERMQRGGSLANALLEAGGLLLRELSERLLGLGTAVVALKLGDQGLYLRTTGDPDRLADLGEGAPGDPQPWLDRELLAPCFKANVVGTTGAGDCTIAGFLAGLLQGLSPEEVMTAAVAVGACSVERADATSGVPAWAAVKRRVQS
ncbi:MAG TPA: carbohydrate kinase family protein, partial [Chloroflexi bacterium]|nr:carbohydrate kinase family protein [Chloroflexota bacterium]